VAVTVHVNERETVTSPSLTDTVTLLLPAAVGVPVICRVAELIDNPTGNPVWVKVSRLPSGSLTDRVNGAMAAPSRLVWLPGGARLGIEKLTGPE
jgi:hypothetical protein